MEKASQVRLVDSHAHLTYDELRNDLDSVLARARAVGVEQVITIGTHPPDWERVIELISSHRGLFAALGVHPHHAGRVSNADLSTLATLMKRPGVVAFGEMGLDYHYDFSDRLSQQRVFDAQLLLARERDLPVIIHSREAVADTVAALDEHGFAGRSVVFHCFTGTRDEAALIAAHGWRISFTGVVTFKKSTELQAIAAEYPPDQLMLETDAPYLSPEPVRNVRPNEPAHLRHTAEFMSQLRRVELAGLADQTTANARRYFALSQETISCGR